MHGRRIGAMPARGHSEAGRVNVTPLIDVVMVLIVFYLIVGHLVLERRGTERLPGTAFGIKENRAADPLSVTLLDDATVLADGVELPIDRLESVIAGRLGREPGLRIRVRAGRDRPFREVQPLIDACRAAGATTIELATERIP